MSPVASETLMGPVNVIDGDTIEMDGQRIRLHGIDAPERDQIRTSIEKTIYNCGQRASEKLSQYTEGRTLHCKKKDTDRYRRIVAVCFVDGQDISELIVRDGYAVAYRRYSNYYIAAENKAKRKMLGMWQAAFTMPWDWRKGVRITQVEEIQHGKCLIKGNISSDGRIYHTPSSPWYERTKINTSKGERWFCSKKEAALPEHV